MSLLIKKGLPVGAQNDDLDSLIKDSIAGNRSAQYRLYKLYSSAMFNICIRMVNDKPEAEDLLQEIFLKVFRDIGKFRGSCTFGVWVKRITINHCLSYIRKKKLVFDDLGQIREENYPEESVEEETITPEMVHESVKSLPDSCRIIFVMHQMEKYKHREIAGMLGISESTSKSQFQHARRLLQTDLKKKCHENEPGLIYR
ncbi:MAG: RNA polymerase sigma factor [Bacteroidota bacterium]